MQTLPRSNVYRSAESILKQMDDAGVLTKCQAVARMLINEYIDVGTIGCLIPRDRPIEIQ